VRTAGIIAALTALLTAAGGCGTGMAAVTETPRVAPPVTTAPVSPAPGAPEVLAEGVAAFSGSWETARDRAVSDALRNAVEQGVGTWVDSETRVENFQLIADRIYSRARGFVSSYRIIHEERENDLYRVVLRAVVNTDGIREDLEAAGILMADQGRPRVMVVVREAGSPSSISREGLESLGSMFETQLLEHFRSTGFPVVDRETASSVLDRNRLLLILQGDDTAAALAGTDAGAEIVVSGTALAGRDDRIIAGSPRTVHVFEVNCRAVNARTGEVLAAWAGTTEVPFSESQARQRASEETADRLITGILQGWTTRENSTVVMVYNTNFTKLQELVDLIEARVRGVHQVAIRDFSGSTASLEVISEIPSVEVIDRLAELEGGFTVTGLSGNRMEIRFD